FDSGQEGKEEISLNPDRRNESQGARVGSKAGGSKTCILGHVDVGGCKPSFRQPQVQYLAERLLEEIERKEPQTDEAQPEVVFRREVDQDAYLKPPDQQPQDEIAMQTDDQADQDNETGNGQHDVVFNERVEKRECEHTDESRKHVIHDADLQPEFDND